MKGLALGLVLLLAATTAVSATVYTDEATFKGQLVAGYYLEDFTAYSFGSYVGGPLTLTQGSWSYTISAAGGGTGQLYSVDQAMSTDSALDSLVVTFGAGVTAVGGLFYGTDFSGFFMPQQVILTLSDGTTETYTPSAISASFRGFTSSIPIASMTIEVPDTPALAWPTMDHFYVGAIPEPTTLGLLALGALLLRRR